MQRSAGDVGRARRCQEGDRSSDVFRLADVDAALAASVFHSGAVAIPELKRELAAAGLEVRDAQ